MARNVTLSQLRTDISAQCDFSTSVSGRYTPTLLNRIINQSIQRFRERISNEGMTHFLVPYSGTITQGVTAPYAFQTIDLSALNPSLVRTYGVDITLAGVVKSLAHRPFTERNDFSVGLGSSMTGTPIAWAHFQTRSIAIMPGPDGSYPYTVWYLPVLPDLAADGDTFDGVAGWEVWVLWDCVCQLIARDQYAAAYTQAIAERDLAWQDIVRSSTKVSAAGGAVVGRDSFGQAGLWGAGRQRGVTAAPGGSNLPSLNSITNGMLSARNGPIVIGRLSALTGDVEDIGIATLMPYLSVYSGAAPGLVPTGGLPVSGLAKAAGPVVAAQLNTPTGTFVAAPVASLIPHVLGVPSGPGQRITSDVTAPYAWGQRRFWIEPDVDTTGVNDATAAIQAALDSRAGACVYLPDGIIRMNSGVTIERGKSLVGRPNGMNFGQLQYGQVANVGTLVKVYGTGKLFTMSEQSTAESLQIYYPNQQTNATPDFYDWTFYCAAGNHGPTIQNIVAPNPYQLIYCAVNGATIDAVQGMPISRGVALGRCADVVRVSRVHFNAGGVFGTSGATLLAWILANGIAFSCDGAENFDFTDCFAYGYKYGLLFRDEDADTFVGSYGSWKGGGFDVCAQAIRVENYALSGLGFCISDAGLPCTSAGNVIEFADTIAANRPAIFASNLRFWGNYASALLIGPTSGGLYSQVGGLSNAASSVHYHAGSGTDGKLRLANVVTVGSGMRAIGANVADIGALVI